MDNVAYWCGMDACFAAARSTDDFISEDAREEEHLCENYAEGIVMCFETEKGSVTTQTTRRITGTNKISFIRVKGKRIHYSPKLTFSCPLVFMVSEKSKRV
jgi:hypothetical protein